MIQLAIDIDTDLFYRPDSNSIFSTLHFQDLKKCLDEKNDIRKYLRSREGSDNQVCGKIKNMLLFNLNWFSEEKVLRSYLRL